LSFFGKSVAAGLALAVIWGNASSAADLFQQGPLRKICDRRGDCVVKFDAIPTNQEWVVNQVSCWYGMTTSNETKVVSISLGTVDKKGVYQDAIFLGAPQMMSYGPTSAAYALLADVTWRMGKGASPAVRFSIESAGPNVGFNSLCSVSGTRP
jgi:hypothetical protein